MKYTVTISAIQEAEVECDNIYDIELLAFRAVENCDWVDFEIENIKDKYGLNPLEDFHCCINCTNFSNKNDLDNGDCLVTCSIDQVPNGHKLCHCCCLYEKGGIQ